MSSSLTPDWSSEFEHYKKLSRSVVTNEDIINFFNQNQKAFYLDTFSSSWGKMMEAYEVKESLSSDQLRPFLAAAVVIASSMPGSIPFNPQR